MAPISETPAHPAVYSIKRHGTTIADCDAEPVQTPGCIQAHGALLVLRPADLTVAQASENVAAFLGVPPEALLGRPVAEAVGERVAGRLRAFLDGEPLDRNPLYVATLDGLGTAAAGLNAPAGLDVTAHTVGDVLIVEIEPTERAAAVPPDTFGLVTRAVGRLQAAETLDAFFQAATEEVRAASGLDRVMVYRFHPDLSGEVVAEARRADLPSWHGLRYPAHDIPLPAREVFRQIWVRPVPDAEACLAPGGLAEMVPLAHPDTGAPLVMTHCALRGPSVMYTEYLRNMRVAATLTLPVRSGSELWGLIACHHYTPTPLPWRVRAACELLAQVTSLQLPNAERRDSADARQRLGEVHDALLRRAATGDMAALVTGALSLLDGVDAGGVAVLAEGRWHTAGAVPPNDALDALADWLRRQPGMDPASDRPRYATDHLGAAFEPAAAYADVAAGLLAVPVTPRHLLLWMRPETVRTVTWAGHPDDAPTVPGPSGPRLTPRASFELWKESVRGRAEPWQPHELEAALRLRGLVVDLVVAHGEALAAVNGELARSNAELDAFAYLASHDLKEPLRGIHKYAFQLAEQAALSADSMPVGSMSAGDDRAERILRLAERMDDLIGALLEFSHVGQTAVRVEPEDVGAVLQEATEMVAARLDEAGVQVVVPRPLPALRCDRVRVREVFANLLTNAAKYRAPGDDPRVEVGVVFPGEADAAGIGGRTVPVITVRDRGIGLAPGQAERVFGMFTRLHGREAYGGGSGIGLALVRKLVEQHGGAVWAVGEPGEGTTVAFTLAPEVR